MERFHAIRSAAHRSTVIAILALGIFAALCADTASAADRGWRLRFSGVLIDSDLAEEGLNDDGNLVRAEIGDDVGLGVGVEYRFSNRLGFALGVALADHDLDVRLEFSDGSSLGLSDGIRVIPITAGPRIHLTPDRAVDVVLGLDLAYVLYGDFTLDSGLGPRVDFVSDDDVSWGASLGVEAPFGDGPWSFVADLQYLDSTLEATDPEDGETTDLDFDPVLLRVGFAYQF